MNVGIKIGDYPSGRSEGSSSLGTMHSRAIPWFMQGALALEKFPIDPFILKRSISLTPKQH